VNAPAERLISDPAPAVVARAAARIAGEAVDQIGAALPRALAGDRDQVRRYVAAYREFTDRLLDAVSEARPDLVQFDQQHHVLVAVDGNARKGRATTVSWVKAALDQEAMSAPFSDWVGTLGAGRGTAVAVASLLRSALPGTEPLPPPRNGRLPGWKLDERGAVRFYRAVVDELSRVETPLEHIASVLGLTRTELAGLFGVRRQALDQWEARGVPAERQAKLATVGAIADLLAAKVKRDRVPGVARRNAPAYGNRTMLEAIAAGDEDQVLSELRDAFDWAVAA
jgi:DNA-binding XRE family transcriptional regulator